MPNNNDDRHELSLEDRWTWHAYIEQEGIAHPNKDDLESFSQMLEQESDVPVNPITQTPLIEKKQASKTKNPPKSNEIDRRTDEKLRKGKMRIDARCDLHGLNKTQAHDVLNNFIQTAVMRGCRCVLVITGKGKSRVATPHAIEPERGILKQKVPEWLAQRNLAPHILKTYTAQPKDGGSGALYVYLRRNR